MIDIVKTISIPQLELKPCPFCGGKAEIRFVKLEGKVSYHVGCASRACQCAVQTCAVAKTVKKAVKAWNTRAKMATQKKTARTSER